MGWFGLGSDTIDKTVDNVLDKDNGLLTQMGSWIGGQQFTDEEKSEANMAMVTSASKFVQDTLSENTVRSKTRRYLALAWVYSELALIFTTVLLAIFSIWFKSVTPEIIAFVWNVASSDLMFYGTIAVLSFFFGNHVLNGLKNKVIPLAKKK